MRRLKSVHILVIGAVVIAVIYLLSCEARSPLEPKITPPGGKIIFGRLDVNQGTSYGIYSMNTDGSNITRVLDSVGMDERHPKCSSDGKKIAFAWDKDDNFEIYTVNIDGTDIKRITNTLSYEYFPRWSPGDSLIAIYRQSTSTGPLDIWLIGLDGKFRQAITSDPTTTDFWPSWSPDGDRIAFVSNRDGDFEIYDKSIEPGTYPNQLTINDFPDECPQYSHSGEWIVFARTTAGDIGYEIYKMRSDGTQITRLTNNYVKDYDPCWSPDDSWIAFRSGSQGNYDIFLMRADGAGIRNITNDPILDCWPDWVE